MTKILHFCTVLKTKEIISCTQVKICHASQLGKASCMQFGLWPQCLQLAVLCKGLGYIKASAIATACWQNLLSFEDSLCVPSHAEVNLTHRSEMPIWTCSGVTLSFLAIFCLTDMMLSFEWHCSGRKMEQTQLVASFPDSVASDGTLGGAWERGYTTCTCLHMQTVYYQVERKGEGMCAYTANSTDISAFE